MSDTGRCIYCGEEFTVTVPSYDRVCRPCMDELTRQRFAEANRKTLALYLTEPVTVTCKCGNTFESKYKDSSRLRCSDCTVENIMKYADTFGVD